LENYLYQMRNSVKDEKCTLSEQDKETVNSTVDEGISWLDTHQSEDKKTYSDKQEEYSAKLTPIFQAASGGQAGGMPAGFDPSQFSQGGGMPAGFDPSQFAQAQGGAAAASSSGGPGVKIEEVD
jgi:uncharacterized protein YhjY with autotransporter beta-barrel domain